MLEQLLDRGGWGDGKARESEIMMGRETQGESPHGSFERHWSAQIIGMWSV
jgi:hypothetical protein